MTSDENKEYTHHSESRIPCSAKRWHRVTPTKFGYHLWFCFTTLYDWFKKTRATYSTNHTQNQNQSRLRTRFPALGAGYMYLLWVLIGPMCCLRLLWLAIVITLVLVSRHSIENRCLFFYKSHRFDLTRTSVECLIFAFFRIRQKMLPQIFFAKHYSKKPILSCMRRLSNQKPKIAILSFWLDIIIKNKSSQNCVIFLNKFSGSPLFWFTKVYPAKVLHCKLWGICVSIVRSWFVVLQTLVPIFSEFTTQTQSGEQLTSTSFLTKCWARGFRSFSCYATWRIYWRDCFRSTRECSC